MHNDPRAKAALFMAKNSSGRSRMRLIMALAKILTPIIIAIVILWAFFF